MPKIMNIEPNIYNVINVRHKKAANILIEKIGSEDVDKKYDIVLDIGCGTGNITVLLESRLNVGHIYGIDVDEEMIAFAKQNHMKDNISYTVQDFGVEFERMTPELKALEGRVSLIFSNFCIHWILNKKLLAKNLYRLLTTGGRVYTNVSSIPNFVANVAPEEKLVYEKWFMRIPERRQQFEDWLTAFKGVGLNIIAKESIKRPLKMSLNDFNTHAMELKVGTQLLYFKGTEMEKMAVKRELPAKILSSLDIITDEITGEDMIAHNFAYFLFISQK